jgi:NitT/TauT family transport system substrate-binding protein
MRRVYRITLLCLLALCPLGGAETLPTLRFSLPPVYESLPVAFAHAWGLFTEHGVNVELVGFTDLDERSAALHTGHLDGLMSDVTHAILNASTGMDLVITATARSQPQTGSMALGLLSPASYRIDTLPQLLSSSHLIGVLRRSDHEYMLDQLVLGSTSADLPVNAQNSAFTDMLQLATMVGAQWLASAVLPEPYISYLTTYAPPGREPVRLVPLAEFEDHEIPPTVVVFRASFVAAHPDAVIAFHKAYNEAVLRLNGSPREEIIDTGLDVAVSLFFQAANVDLIGQDVLDAIPIPRFGRLGDLDPEQFEAISQWMSRKKYLYGALPAYGDFFDGRFLP